MPPALLMASAASRKPFNWNLPGAASGPVCAVTIPNVTVPSAQCAVVPRDNAATAARTNRSEGADMRRSQGLLGLRAETIDPQCVVAKEKLTRLRIEAQRVDLVACALEGEHRIVGAEQH